MASQANAMMLMLNGPVPDLVRSLPMFAEHQSRSASLLGSQPASTSNAFADGLLHAQFRHRYDQHMASMINYHLQEQRLLKDLYDGEVLIRSSWFMQSPPLLQTLQAVRLMRIPDQIDQIRMQKEALSDRRDLMQAGQDAGGLHQWQRDMISYRLQNKLESLDWSVQPGSLRAHQRRERASGQSRRRTNSRPIDTNPCSPPFYSTAGEGTWPDPSTMPTSDNLQRPGHGPLPGGWSWRQYNGRVWFKNVATGSLGHCTDIDPRYVRTWNHSVRDGRNYFTHPIKGTQVTTHDELLFALDLAEDPRLRTSMNDHEGQSSELEAELQSQPSAEQTEQQMKQRSNDAQDVPIDASREQSSSKKKKKKAVPDQTRNANADTPTGSTADEASQNPNESPEQRTGHKRRKDKRKAKETERIAKFERYRMERDAVHPDTGNNVPAQVAAPRDPNEGAAGVQPESDQPQGIAHHGSMRAMRDMVSFFIDAYVIGIVVRVFGPGEQGN